MADIIIDGDFEGAAPISAIRYSAPIPGVKKYYVCEQDFCQLVDEFAPLEIGAQHPDLAGFYLVEETPLQPTSVAHVMKWTRIYAQVPDTHSDPDSVSYNFIGFFPAGAGDPGRGRFTATVPARVQSDYFLIGTEAYPTILDVPQISEQRYYAAWPDAVSLGLETDVIAYIAQSPYAPNTPTRLEYEAMITDEDEIVAVGSYTTRWKGNIVRRVTVYIRAR